MKNKDPMTLREKFKKIADDIDGGKYDIDEIRDYTTALIGIIQLIILTADIVDIISATEPKPTTEGGENE